MVIPHPQYVLSKRGNPNLTLNNYQYIVCDNSGKGSDKRIRWRCSYKRNQRYVCKAKAHTVTVDGVEIARFIGEHCH